MRLNGYVVLCGGGMAIFNYCGEVTVMSTFHHMSNLDTPETTKELILGAD